MGQHCVRHTPIVRKSMGRRDGYPRSLTRAHLFVVTVRNWIAMGHGASDRRSSTRILFSAIAKMNGDVVKNVESDKPQSQLRLVGHQLDCILVTFPLAPRFVSKCLSGLPAHLHSGGYDQFQGTPLLSDQQWMDSSHPGRKLISDTTTLSFQVGAAGERALREAPGMECSLAWTARVHWIHSGSV